ncbi:MAG: FAD-binding oxidoreductase [Fibrobacteria bacterium]|nr:FAD-binding oxidoreductase [Fibrobacteria bacterium]
MSLSGNPSLVLDNRALYLQKKAQLLSALKQQKDSTIGLNKATSNLFRHRLDKTKSQISLKDFNGVVSLDTENCLAEVEGVATYETIVDALLPHGHMPTVVPELKTITLGGATTGVGIESSSFRYGLVHETIAALDLLTSSGDIIECRPDNEHRNLFYGFPNSYGTLGYASKLTVKTHPVKKYVRLRHIRHTHYKDYFAELERYCKDKETYDFIDGVIFSSDEMYICLATFTDEAPYTSDYTGMNIYFRSLQQKEEDYISTRDYIWRWDTDWFWCSKFFFAQVPWVRRLYGRDRLRSTTYWAIRNFCSRYKITNLLEKISRQPKEMVIQDVEIPVQHSEAFMQFFQKHIGISPVWVCPTKVYDPNAQYSLYTMDPDRLYINFGFWDVVPTTHEDGYHNRLIEDKVEELKGKKSLYSTSFYSEEKFWKLYNRDLYEELKKKYDPQGKFKNLFDKCVGN